MGFRRDGRAVRDTRERRANESSNQAERIELVLLTAQPPGGPGTRAASPVGSTAARAGSRSVARAWPLRRISEDPGRPPAVFLVRSLARSTGPPAVECGGDFPGQVGGVADAGVEAVAAPGRVQAGGVAHQVDAVAAVAGRQQHPRRPGVGGQDLKVHFGADEGVDRCGGAKDHHIRPRLGRWPTTCSRGPCDPPCLRRPVPPPSTGRSVPARRRHPGSRDRYRTLMLDSSADPSPTRCPGCAGLRRCAVAP